MIQLQEGAPFEKYGRVNEHRVKLVDEDSFLSFELEELYLSLTVWWSTVDTPSSPLASEYWDSRQFEVVLSTNCESTISLNEDYYTPDQLKTKFIDQQRQIYDLRITIDEWIAKVHLLARRPTLTTSDAKDNSMEFTVVINLLRDLKTSISIVSVDGTQANFNHGRDSGEAFHDRKIVRLPDGTFVYLALKETKAPKGSRLKRLAQLEFSDDEHGYESESSEDIDSREKCNTLYATLLASGEAEEPQGHGTL